MYIILNAHTKKVWKLIVCTSYIYVYIYIYQEDFALNDLHWLILGAFNKFPTFFVQAFKIVVDSWTFSMLLLYMLWDDWPIFMISGSNQSWWISKMQSGREDTLKERYVIKFCFKVGKNATETYGMLQTAFEAFCMNRASVFEWHKRFKKAWESVRDYEVWGE